MFASNVKKTVTVGETAVVIRKLSASALEEAREARQLAVTSMAVRLGPELIKSFRESAKESKPVVEATADPYAEFDRTVTLQKGVVSWNAVAEDTKKPIQVQAGILDLDEDTADFLFHEIVDLSRKNVDPKVS